ncbi:cell wall metabolism sensor histidine kinase WalK [Lentilactobacillus parabuchneri]|uniref:histidine kinase n=2 Tax=Lentilactobacillus parabuchneri TaxID=152331 RepID=A0A1X1FFN0_9LACO|nr:cell wall metabolism sensor histidine kinase WalK [Lentilactobacillus parabuchneri]APR07205.1 Sensor histidine kinase YycG [Lentilactobacillus parabuchneri]KRM47437.1 multi-sensor signal transduction histidine kinase [Lentilactobacillus parabuchneri DSM 5707 = NBRC 107865]KRN79875.1 multi-sensor signal transduction histidine kinase [Lentilactobacillus parabuchneri]MBW0222772.1 cell wall metabolism sensor histidine kinase WalK [Lentilactobacillus parabuchneri]MBW0245251.1 cell wall metabolis
MNNRIKFYQSIKFKIALVFALILLVTLEIVGAVFVRQLEHQNLATFKNQIQLQTYVTNSLTTELSLSNETKANSRIKTILNDSDSNNSAQIQVIDNKGTIRGTNQINNQAIVGQKTTDDNVKNAIYNGKKFEKTTFDSSTGARYYTLISPLIKSSNNNSTVVGVVYTRANLDSVYDSINSVTLIYLFAASIAIILGLLISIVISRAITRPIEEMKKQTIRIARGDYSGQVHVYGNDELGQLASAVNNLSVRVEESHESTESERRRLDSVLANMTDGVLATDRRGNVIIINETAASFLDLDENQAMGKSILDVLDIRKDYSLRDLLEKPDELILDFSSEDHSLVLHAHFSLIQRESGFISGLVCVLRDITEQQRIEQDRKQFVSNVSHELRTPLTSVRSYIEALSDGAWKDPKLAPKFLKVTQDETDRMIRMINDLLTLSRMDSGTQKMEVELVNINELFNYVLNRFDMILKKEDHPEKTYTIKRYFTKRDLWVELDTDRFTQVLDNLMNNAIKYSPDGGVITCRLYETRNKVILSVSDQGLGIPRKDIPHIFDRFYRVDKARSRQQGGSGLGLAISKETVEALHGQIWAESVEGKGSTFYIALPYEPVEEEDLWDEV